MGTKKTRKLVIRYERTQNIKEAVPCRYETFEVSRDEIAVFVETDYRHRCEVSDDLASVKRRDAQEILIEEINKPEYNQAKKHLRHTRYESMSSNDDEEDVSIIEVTASNEGDDPAAAWIDSLAVREAFRQLDARDLAVIVGIHLHGYTQAQIAKALGVSQPAVAKRLKKAEARLRDLLS